MESFVERILVRVVVFSFLQSDDYKLKILKCGGARPDPTVFFLQFVGKALEAVTTTKKFQP